MGRRGGADLYGDRKLRQSLGEATHQNIRHLKINVAGKRLLIQPANGQKAVFFDELGPEEQAALGQALQANPAIRRRDVEQRQVKWAVINAMDVLDEEEWEGRYIPVVPVIGKEYNVGGKRAWKGIVSS